MLRFQTILARRDGGNREPAPRVAGRAPSRAGFLAGQGDRGSRHMPAARVRNHALSHARDGLRAPGREEEEKGDRESQAAYSTGSQTEAYHAAVVREYYSRKIAATQESLLTRRRAGTKSSGKCNLEGHGVIRGLLFGSSILRFPASWVHLSFPLCPSNSTLRILGTPFCRQAQGRESQPLFRPTHHECIEHAALRGEANIIGSRSLRLCSR